MQSLPEATPGCILFWGRALRSLKSRLDYRVIHRLRIRRSLPPTLGTSSTNERVSIVNDRFLFLPSLSLSLSLSFSLSPYPSFPVLSSPPPSIFSLSIPQLISLSFSFLVHLPPFSPSLPGALGASSLKRIPIKGARMSSYVLFTGQVRRSTYDDGLRQVNTTRDARPRQRTAIASR